MPRKKVEPKLTKWGFPRNIVTSAFARGVPAEAVAWGTTRDEIDAQLLDLLDAFEAGVIDRPTYQKESAPLLAQMKQAVSKYVKALGRGPVKKRTPSKAN